VKRQTYLISEEECAEETFMELIQDIMRIIKFSIEITVRNCYVYPFVI
jgi:hypothetical protein